MNQFFEEHIEVITRVRVLGLMFQMNLLFFSHIEYVCIRTSRCLGFITRNTKDLKNETCLKTLYTSLVRPILEYCSIIWNTHQKGLIEAIERDQRRILRLIVYKLNTPFNINSLIILPLSSVQASLDLDSLVNRRTHNVICFLSKLVNGSISCPEL